MKQSETSLYLKTSSIYNKIMQLAIAIVFIILLMNMWIAGGVNDKALISDYFYDISNQYLNQAGSGLQILLVNSENELIQQTVDELAKMKFVKSVHLYDETGQVLFFSSSESVASDSINDLYGISPYKDNTSAKFVPFVQEIRTDKLLGYLRFTIEKEQLSDVLNEASDQRQQLLRVMLILAGLVGFLLTRGFNRFSRQGYRIPQKQANR
jgi:membrane protein